VAGEQGSQVVFTEYFRFRAELRSYSLAVIERLLRESPERYFDTESRRHIVVGRHDERLVMVAYERDGLSVRAVTVHAVSRQQVRLRVNSGRLKHEA
jgi:hypothetical protein